MTTSQAITLYFNQISLRKGLPFAVAIPNTETAQAIEAALAGINLYKAESVDALFDDLRAGICRPVGTMRFICAIKDFNACPTFRSFKKPGRKVGLS